MEEKLVFIDETGDTGSRKPELSSNLFVIAAVVVDKAHISHLEQLVNDAKVKCKKDELKFSRLSEKHRRMIFTDLASQEFSFYSIVVDKRLLYSPGFLYSHVFYKYFFGKLISLLGERYCRVEIHFDQNGNEGFQEGLKRYIKKRYEQPTLFEPFAMVAHDSRLSELTQIADLIAGAVGRATNAHKKRHRDDWFLSQLFRQQRLIKFWPTTRDGNTDVIFGPTINDSYLEAESERRMKLILKSQEIDQSQIATAELLLYEPTYIPCISLVNELDRLGLTPSQMHDDQKRQWVQRHIIRILRDKGALIDSNSGTLDSGYGMIRSISQAQNFRECQIKRAYAMVRRAETVAEAVEIATNRSISISQISQEILLSFMRLVNSQTGKNKRQSN